MNNRDNISKVLMMVSAVFLFCQKAQAQKSFDSLKIKQPKHYFQTVILLDGYRKPTQNLGDTIELVGERLKTYGVKQSVLSVCVPIATRESRNSDSSITKNVHYLLTFNYMSFKPQFSGISEHQLVKSGLGLRIIINPGKKGLWFFDAAPFVTKDNTYPQAKAYKRWATTIVYSHNASEKFNWRLGVTKSFLWGNRFYLPFVGLRFGRLDRTHLSIQFPRCINLNIPIKNNVLLSVYTKPQGGMWSFSNHDSLYTLKSDATFYITRYEINTGFRLDARITNWFSFYLATGFSTENKITFYSDNANKKNNALPYSKFFYENSPAATFFTNIGLVFKFGRTKSYLNNRNIYDAIDLNNTVGTGDDNLSNGNFQIPVESKKRAEQLKLKSVQDLIDYNDF